MGGKSQAKAAAMAACYKQEATVCLEYKARPHMHTRNEQMLSGFLNSTLLSVKRGLLLAGERSTWDSS